VRLVQKELNEELAETSKETSATVKQHKEGTKTNIDLKIKAIKGSTSAEIHSLETQTATRNRNYQEKGAEAIAQIKIETKERLDLLGKRVADAVSELDQAKARNAHSLQQDGAEAAAEFARHKESTEADAQHKEQALTKATQEADKAAADTVQQGHATVQKNEEASAQHIAELKATTEAKLQQITANSKVMTEDGVAMIKTAAKVKAEEMKTLEEVRTNTDNKIKEADRNAANEIKRLADLADHKVSEAQIAAQKEMNEAEQKSKTDMIQNRKEADARMINFKKVAESEAKLASDFQTRANQEIAHIKGDLQSHIDHVKHEAEVVVHEAQKQAEERIAQEKSKHMATKLATAQAGY